MKTLYLLRHAKSSWKQPGLSDTRRPLNKRGKRNAPEMAGRFAERDEKLDRIISSPAERARATAAAFAVACRMRTEYITEADSLYFEGPEAFAELISRQNAQVGSLLLVSHNPDITSFANSLDDRLSIDNVPTCGLLRFDCHIENWSDWTTETCEFVYYDYPKNQSIEPLFNTRMIR